GDGITGGHHEQATSDVHPGQLYAGAGEAYMSQDQESHDPNQPTQTQGQGHHRSKGCNSPGDLITAVNRVLRDPRVTAGVRDLLYDAAEGRDASSVSSQGKVAAALGHIASAFGGTDAVRAQGEPCRGQFRVAFFMEDPQTGKPELISPDLVRRIDAQLI